MNVNSIGIKTIDSIVDNKNDNIASTTLDKNKYNSSKKKSDDNLKYGKLIKGIILIIIVSYKDNINNTMIQDINLARHNLVLDVCDRNNVSNEFAFIASDIEIVAIIMELKNWIIKKA